MTRLFFTVVVLILLLSCTQQPGTDQGISAETTPAIKVFAQDRPGGEPHEFQMPVGQGLDRMMLVDYHQSDLDEDDLIIGLPARQPPLAIPIRYLTGFEVANVQSGDAAYLVTWCPLVGSAKVFDIPRGGEEPGFDFGWGLVNNNLLVVDRSTRSVWSQLSGEAIAGPKKGDQLTGLPTLQTTWTFWKNRFPDTQVAINRDTAGAPFPGEVFRKDYYAQFIPGVKNNNQTPGRHNTADLGIGLIVNGQPRFYPFTQLQQSASPLAEEVDGLRYQIHFDLQQHTAWAEIDGELMSHTLVYQRSWERFFREGSVYQAGENR